LIGQIGDPTQPVSLVETPVNRGCPQFLYGLIRLTGNGEDVAKVGLVVGPTAVAATARRNVDTLDS
jgi:hypothetical protein